MSNGLMVRALFTGLVQLASCSAIAEQPTRVFGHARMALHTGLPQTVQQEKESVYGEVMTPNGVEQTALRDFRLLSRWRDMRYSEILKEPEIYLRNESELLQIYSQVADWGVEDYVNARATLALTTRGFDDSVAVVNSNGHYSYYLWLGSHALVLAALPLWSPAVAGIGVAAFASSVVFHIRQGFWNGWLYMNDYGSLLDQKVKGETALAQLKDHTPALEKARKMIYQPLFKNHAMTLNQKDSDAVTAKCQNAGALYMTSPVYQNSMLANDDVKSLVDVFKTVAGAGHGRFTLELLDDRYPAKQNFRFELLLCKSKLYIKDVTQHQSGQVYARIHDLSGLKNFAEELSLLSDLNKFRFKVEDIPLYSRVINYSRALAVEGLVHGEEATEEGEGNVKPEESISIIEERQKSEEVEELLPMDEELLPISTPVEEEELLPIAR
ncbi:hypothetical protein [Parendozoicomonas sp. Alg238-R29]|uniref:hypothetical protein n=1 Tax=Parendozoicomonas sp. Alg238-R29 TaxID=2993446 RepID=UPI00248E85B1|nr:hypothetical protein [Parendozoicomonas sp. Alg238-R29]